MSLRPQKIAPRLSSPFERIGGREPIAQLVARFYGLMESDPAFAELRAIHGPDLAAMGERLTDFLMGWMGGPRDWFDRNPGACILSAHGAMPGIDRQTADQWMACMSKAARPLHARDPALAETLLNALRAMGDTMILRARQAAEQRP